MYLFLADVFPGGKVPLATGVSHVIRYGGANWFLIGPVIAKASTGHGSRLREWKVPGLGEREVEGSGSVRP